jgi:hypothetical protein|tara:strand:- start:790 stop:978 length:189 start_codon:yes stop_codon:yes gene_type:complete
MVDRVQNWLRRAVPGFEDEALMTGDVRFIDDLSPVPGIRHLCRCTGFEGMVRAIAEVAEGQP